MQIEQSYDKVVLTNDEVQEALRKAVETKTGRIVRGHVVVNHNVSSDRILNRVKIEPCKPVTEGAAYCYLEPEASYVRGA